MSRNSIDKTKEKKKEKKKEQTLNVATLQFGFESLVIINLSKGVRPAICVSIVLAKRRRTVGRVLQTPGVQRPLSTPPALPWLRARGERGAQGAAKVERLPALQAGHLEHLPVVLTLSLTTVKTYRLKKQHHQHQLKKNNKDQN